MNISDAYCTNLRVLETRQENPYRNVYIWSSMCFCICVSPTLSNSSLIKACMVTAIVVSETISSKPSNCMSHVGTTNEWSWFNLPRTAVYQSLNCLGIEGSVATAIQYICLILYELGKSSLYPIPCRYSELLHPFRYASLELYCIPENETPKSSWPFDHDAISWRGYVRGSYIRWVLFLLHVPPLLWF